MGRNSAVSRWQAMATISLFQALLLRPSPFQISPICQGTRSQPGREEGEGKKNGYVKHATI